MTADLACPVCRRAIPLRRLKSGSRLHCVGCRASLTVFGAGQAMRLAALPPSLSFRVRTRVATLSAAAVRIFRALPVARQVGLGAAAALAVLLLIVVVGMSSRSSTTTAESGSDVAVSVGAPATAGPGREQAAAPGTGASHQLSTLPVLTTKEVVQLAEPSVCRIRTRHGSLGTGFVIGPQLIATNEHVLGAAGDAGSVIEFVSRNRVQFRTATLAYAARAADLVILRVPDLPDEYAALRPAPISDLQKGERMIVIGNPGGLENVVTEGIFGSIQESEGARYLQLSVAINPGNSGGPALTDQGRVAGIVTFKSGGNEGIGLAIPGDVLLRALNELQQFPADALRKNVATWRARQTGSRLLHGCRLAAAILSEQRRDHALATAAMVDPGQLLNAHANEYATALQTIELLCDDVPRVLLALRAEPLDSSGLALLSRLDECFRSAQDSIRSPPATAAELDRELEQLTRRTDGLEGELRRSFGLMDLRSAPFAPIEIMR